jgi:virginiamycin B lyase
MATSGLLTTATTPSGASLPLARSRPFSIATPYNTLNCLTGGPDGSLWFTEHDGHIGRITPAGTNSTYALPSAASRLTGIAQRPDGALWFSETGTGAIGGLSL